MNARTLTAPFRHDTRPAADEVEGSAGALRNLSDDGHRPPFMTRTSHGRARLGALTAVALVAVSVLGSCTSSPATGALADPATTATTPWPSLTPVTTGPTYTVGAWEVCGQQKRDWPIPESSLNPATMRSGLPRSKGTLTSKGLLRFTLILARDCQHGGSVSFRPESAGRVYWCASAEDYEDVACLIDVDPTKLDAVHIDLPDGSSFEGTITS